MESVKLQLNNRFLVIDQNNKDSDKNIVLQQILCNFWPWSTISGGWGVSSMMMIKIIAMNNNDDGGLNPGFHVLL